MSIVSTGGSRIVGVLRILAGLPLVVFGAMHLIGVTPMGPLVEAAGMHMPDLAAIVAPVTQVVAGALLAIGLLARVGALGAIGVMLGAIYTHWKIPSDAWPVPVEGAPHTEPQALLYLAIGIVVVGLIVLWRGAGAWSVDARLDRPEPAKSGDSRRR